MNFMERFIIKKITGSNVSQSRIAKDNITRMTFVGQLEIEQDKIKLHDDALFYVFWDREIGTTKTIIQIA